MTAPSPPAIRLSIDAATLRHLAVGTRGLVRYRIDNPGGVSLVGLELVSTLSGAPIEPVGLASLEPGRSAELAIAVVPQVAGFHELAGELALAHPRARYRFAVHVRAAGEGPAVSVVNIDQSSARVVDNSRSTFAPPELAGLVGDGEWQVVALTLVPEPVAPPPPVAPTHVAFAVTTPRATYRARAVLAQGDISTVYTATADGADVVLKVADVASDNDLLDHEARVLENLAAAPAPDAPKQHIPVLRDQFRTADGRLGNVLDRADGLDLDQVRDRCIARGDRGLPARHVLWILRRTLAALGLAHRRGILHGNLAPAHLLVRPRDHMVWVVDWCWAVVDPARAGAHATFKVLDDVYGPPEVRERGRPTPASDVYALGKCAIYLLGGDPANKTLPHDLDPRFARFVRFMTVESQGGRPQDAWDLHQQLGRLRQQIWGAHVFVPLEL